MDATQFSDGIYFNKADYTAFASSASEGSLLSGQNEQVTIPANFFRKERLALRLRAWGVISNTGTPTIVFQWRVGSTQGASDLTGTSVAQNAAITTTSGITNQFWVSELLLVVRTPGQGSGNCTLNSFGTISGRGWMGSSGYDSVLMVPSSGSPAAWTSTINAAVQNYVNLSVTWSASSASNTITCKQLEAVSVN